MPSSVIDLIRYTGSDVECAETKGAVRQDLSTFKVVTKGSSNSPVRRLSVSSVGHWVHNHDMSLKQDARRVSEKASRIDCRLQFCPTTVACGFLV
jgi:hypothetical protein